MKQFALNTAYSKLNWLISGLMALTFMLFSLTTLAAQPAGGDAPERATARDFNHVTTGFPLTGLHATVECGTCHVAGVFKGTPRNCAGCHSQGMRVVATSKSQKHLITTEPCEVCHNNTVTFYGAKYNHGKANVGQCAICHNGNIAAGRPVSHSSGVMAQKACDSCHRTYAWSPATWNHTSAGPGTCANAGCHVQGSNQYFKSTSTHTRTGMATYNCDSCHSYIAWSPAQYNHSGAGASTTCSGCHNGTVAVGKSAGHVSTTAECSSCHSSRTTWSGALGAAPPNHSGSITASCTVCHVGALTTHVTGSTLHSNFTTTVCKTCHLRSGSTYNFVSAEKDTLTHEGGGSDCSQSGCHRPAGTKGITYIEWD